MILDPTIQNVTSTIYSEDKELFGAFRDACPDRWGKKLIDRRESIRAAEEGRHPRQYFDTDYLCQVDDECRNGGFRFRIDENGPLEQISLGYENNSDNKWVNQLVKPGSSLGGARPKANLQIEGLQPSWSRKED